MGWQAEKLKRQQEKPQNNHRKNLRKNLPKVIDKEAPELNREELEDKLDGLINADLETLSLVVSDRGARSVLDCVVDAMAELGCPVSVPKGKKKKKKNAPVKSEAGGGPPSANSEENSTVGDK